MQQTGPLRLKGLVPSSALLRYLRSQTVSQSQPLSASCFFTPNARSAASISSPSWYDLADAALRGPDGNNGQSRSPWRRKVKLEASFPPFELFSPRSKGSKQPHLACPQTRSGQAVKTRKGDHALYSSSHGNHPWLRKMWELRKGGRQSGLQPDDLPHLPTMLGEGTETSIFNIGRSVTGKGPGEVKLRCTEFDDNGNVTLVNGEFKKSELIAKYGLLPRDLRKIDSSLLPHILVRPSAILINLLHLRVLIKHNHVLVFDVYGSTDSYTQSVFMYDLEGRLRQREGSRQAGGLPYEFRALEAVLISVTSGLEAEFEGVREPVNRVLRELEEDIDRDKLRHLLIYSKKLGTFEQKAKLVRDAIDELLDADDDLAAMYLTEKQRGGIRGEEDHTEVEMLLESYHKLCDEIVQESGNLVSNIRNTEEIVKAILDANRNSLMLLDLKFSIGTLGIGSGAFIAALYGMNLKNFMEESDLGFAGVSAWSFAFAAVVCAYGLTKLRKVQRVSMWGEQGSRGRRGSWRSLEGPGHSAARGAGALPGAHAQHPNHAELRAERVHRAQQGKRSLMELKRG